MRDAKITQIYEGTNQVQRIVMARQTPQGRLTRIGQRPRYRATASLDLGEFVVVEIGDRDRRGRSRCRSSGSDLPEAGRLAVDLQFGPEHRGFGALVDVGHDRRRCPRHRTGTEHQASRRPRCSCPASHRRGRSGRRPRGSPGVLLVVQVFVREPFGVFAGLGEPDLALQEPQRPPNYVGRSLIRPHGGADDPFVILGGSEADRSRHESSVRSLLDKCGTRSCGHIWRVASGSWAARSARVARRRVRRGRRWGAAQRLGHPTVVHLLGSARRRWPPGAAGGGWWRRRSPPRTADGIRAAPRVTSRAGGGLSRVVAASFCRVGRRVRRRGRGGRRRGHRRGRRAGGRRGGGLGRLPGSGVRRSAAAVAGSWPYPGHGLGRRARVGGGAGPYGARYAGCPYARRGCGPRRTAAGRTARRAAAVPGGRVQRGRTWSCLRHRRGLEHGRAAAARPRQARAAGRVRSLRPRWPSTDRASRRQRGRVDAAHSAHPDEDQHRRARRRAATAGSAAARRAARRPPTSAARPSERITSSCRRR